MNAVTSLHSTADMPGASVVWLTMRDFILFQNLWGALQKVGEQAGRIAITLDTNDHSQGGASCAANDATA